MPKKQYTKKELINLFTNLKTKILSYPDLKDDYLKLESDIKKDSNTVNVDDLKILIDDYLAKKETKQENKPNAKKLKPIKKEVKVIFPDVLENDLLKSANINKLILVPDLKPETIIKLFKQNIPVYLAHSWTKQDIKKYEYAKAQNRPKFNNFPSDLDVTQVIFITSDTQKEFINFYSTSVYNESFWMNSFESFEVIENIRYFKSLEFQTYINADNLQLAKKLNQEPKEVKPEQKEPQKEVEKPKDKPKEETKKKPQKK